MSLSSSSSSSSRSSSSSSCSSTTTSSSCSSTTTSSSLSSSTSSSSSSRSSNSSSSSSRFRSSKCGTTTRPCADLGPALRGSCAMRVSDTLIKVEKKPAPTTFYDVGFRTALTYIMYINNMTNIHIIYLLNMNII